MTKLTYRTVSHTGTEAKAPRSAAALTYRGVAHDGLGSAATDRSEKSAPVQMVYRGVRHLAGKALTGATVRMPLRHALAT